MAASIARIEPPGERRRSRRARPLLAAGLLVAWLWACAPAAPAPSGSNAGGPGGPFNLVDQDGRAVDQRLLEGKWSLVFFGYTFCPDVCPTTLAALGQAMKDLGPKAGRVQVVFVTVDPARDTPAALKRYLAAGVFPRNIVGLTGTPDQIAQVAKEYVVYYQKDGTGPNYTMDHSTAIYVMDPKGRFRSVIADGLSPQEDAQQIASAMDGA
jgi:protein SCO1/2